MSKARTGMLEQGTQRRPLLQTSSPLKPKINRGLTLELVQQTGAHHHHSPARACVSPAGGSVAVIDCRNSSKVILNLPNNDARRKSTHTMRTGGECHGELRIR
jgi:hypothetical protein